MHQGFVFPPPPYNVPEETILMGMKLNNLLPEELKITDWEGTEDGTEIG